MKGGWNEIKDYNGMWKGERESDDGNGTGTGTGERDVVVMICLGLMSIGKGKTILSFLCIYLSLFRVV